MANVRKKSGYSSKDLRDVSASPRLTKADFAKAQPFSKVFPDLSESIRKNSRTPGKKVKREVS